MALVLTAAGVIACPHQGVVQVTPGQTSFTAGGSPVLVVGDLDGKPIAGCTVVTNPNAGTIQCTLTVGVTTGAAHRTKAGDRAVLLDTAQGSTNGAPPATFTVHSAGQTLMGET